MSIGQLFRNYRIFMAIVAYFAISITISTVLSVVNLNSNVLAQAVVSSHTSSFDLTMMWSILIELVLGVIYYIFAHYIINKHLNIQ